MKNLLSLSVRIAEGFLSKEEAILNLDEVADLAHKAGYDALCMRASQLGIQSNADHVATEAAKLHNASLPITMVTGDFDIVHNNEKGPACLRNITPFLDLADTLRCSLIRVALKNEDDITAAQKAADEAKERHITLAHQCHTLSLFETIDSCEKTLRRINRENFGLIYEPANLEICGEAYTGPVFERLAPWIKNIYLQNQILKPDGKVTLETWCRGPISFDLIPVHDPSGVDFAAVFSELRQIGYQGPITVHQSAQPGETPLETAKRSAEFLRTLMNSAGVTNE